MSILDFFKSKEEREKESKAYFDLIFPFGEEQRCHINKVLNKIFPDIDQTNLLYLFIVIKEFHVDDELPQSKKDKKIQEAYTRSRLKLNDNQMNTLEHLIEIDAESKDLLSVNDYLSKINNHS